MFTIAELALEQGSTTSESSYELDPRLAVTEVSSRHRGVSMTRHGSIFEYNRKHEQIRGQKKFPVSQRADPGGTYSDRESKQCSVSIEFKDRREG